MIDKVRNRVVRGGLLVSSKIHGLGYTLGSGDAVTQITTAATGVTVTGLSGQITTVALTTAAGAEERFTVTCPNFKAKDAIALGTTYAGAGTPALSTMANTDGTFDVVITNLHASAALNAVLVINWAVVRVAIA